MFVEEDVSGWAVIQREQGGRDENKFWLAENADASRAEQWLWKPRRMTADGTVPQINDAAEVIAFRLAGHLGLPAAECRFAVRGEQVGVISHNVTPSGFDLHDAGTFLSEVSGYARHRPVVDADGRERGRLRMDEGYTLEAARQVLEGVGGPPGWEHHSGFTLFAGYLVLDALIANTDRHPRNWALLVDRRDGRRAIAPTFDHGSALGSGLTDCNRRRRNVEDFCGRGKANPFTPREELAQLAHRAVLQADAAVWLDRVGALAPWTIRETLEAPPSRVSEDAARFMEQVLTVNQRRLCDVDGA